MKLIKQHDEKDCGAACLSMIANYFGFKDSIASFRELTKTDRNGTSLFGITDAADKIGFSAEALSGNMVELLEEIKNGNLQEPFIAHVITKEQMLHFVVVYKITKKKIYVADPARGKLKYSFEEFNKIWDGYIVTFKKTDRFKKANKKGRTIFNFFSLLRHQYITFILISILSLIVSGIGIIGAFVFESVIDQTFYEEETDCEDNCSEEHEHIKKENQNILDKVINIFSDKKSLNKFFIALIILYILQSLIQFVRGVLMAKLSLNIDLKLMLRYFCHLFKLPVASVLMRNTGEYLSRFSDASTIRNAISGATLTLIMDTFMAIAGGYFLYAENKILFCISLIMIILYSAIVLIYIKPISKANKKIMENNAKVESYFKESIDGVVTVKANQAERTVNNKNTGNFVEMIRSVFKGNLIEASQDSLCSLVEAAGIVAILWLGFVFVEKNEITVGSLMSFYALLAYFSTPIKNIINVQPMLQTAVVAAERLNDILCMKEEETNSSEIKDWQEIKLENVDFRYGNNELILKNISFGIKKGEKVAIIGESGSGKTTIAKLLMRFYLPENGKIKIDSENINNIGLDCLRKKIAYVDQNTYLFSDTIANNLKMGNPDVDDDKMKLVCDALNITDFINNLPFGFDTFLDENGFNLSGGQRQRIAIARALLRQPEILILDESTSNLDVITENDIKNGLNLYNKDMTCIIIAHRLRYITECDRIIVMNKGEIKASGSHKQLMVSSELYQKIIEANQI